MVPIFFPYTYIPASTAAAVNAFIGKVGIFQPSPAALSPTIRTLADNGQIEPAFPVTENDNVFMRSVRAFQEWGQFHQKRDLAFFKSVMDETPNYDQMSISRIRSELGKMIHHPKMAEEKKEKKKLSRESYIWWARLFLQFAQEFDETQDEVGDVLDRVDQMTQDLFNNIKGEKEELDLLANPPEGMSGNDGFKEYNVVERIKAWTGLFMELPPDTAGIFVTDNLRVIEYLQASELIEKAGEKLIPAGVASGWDDAYREKLVKGLSAWASGEVPDLDDLLCPNASGKREFEKGHILEIYSAQGMSPRDLFSRFIPKNISEDAYPEKEKNIKNSIVCYVHS